VQCLAKLNLSALRLQSLALQIEDDQACARSIRNTDTNGFAGQTWPKARLHDKRHMIGVDLPAHIVGKFLVRQRTLSPSAVKEADFAFFRPGFAVVRQTAGISETSQ
jgi:hypothetical protein